MADAREPYAGADRVILTLAAAIAVAFVVAAADWLVELATGRRLLSRLARQVTFVMVPPLLLIFLVLGTIFIGLATPTEGGAMGALGALVLAFVRRLGEGNPKRCNIVLVRSAAEATARLSAFVLFILIGARIFSLTFYGINGHLWVERLFTSLPGGETGFLVVVNLLVFVLAFFLDFFKLAFIVVPLIAPVADRLGIGLVWFGVMLAVNMQTSFMPPPFGFALFFLRSVAPREAYLDKLTGKRTEPVTTGPNLLGRGAVPGDPARRWWRSARCSPVSCCARSRRSGARRRADRRTRAPPLRDGAARRLLPARHAARELPARRR